MNKSAQTDFGRYFSAKQRAYLINISEERDKEQYESLSGTVVSCLGTAIALQIPYATGQECPQTSPRQTTYKITSESMGSGIQIMADLAESTAENVFHINLHGAMEMYQRRQMPRIDINLDVFQIRRDATLAIYRKEFKRIMDTMNTKKVRPNLKLQDTPVNLSTGGIRIAIDALEKPSRLSMFFLDLDAGQPLVCAVAELAWHRHEKDKLVCGYRFMQIQKTDQERISRYVQSIQKDRGVTDTASRTYWELLDRMTGTEPEKRP